MKLRIQGNSLRLRISRSELARFVESGRLEETIYFGSAMGSELTYTLARDCGRPAIGVESSPGQVRVLVPDELATEWAASERVGISGDVDLGVRGMLLVLVEKDFACLERSGDENADTFPNPLAAHVC